MRKLEAQVAFLTPKNRLPLKARKRSQTGTKPWWSLGFQGRGLAVRPLEAAGLARSSYYYALAHPQQPTRVHLRPKVAQDLFAYPQRVRSEQVAMCLRAEEGVRIADKTVLKMMRQMGLRCGIRREGLPRVQLLRGEVGQSLGTSSVATSRLMVLGEVWY